MKKILLVAILALVATTLAACSWSQPATQDNTNQPAQEQSSDTPAQLANPASVNCEDSGGTLLLMTKTVDGQDLGQYGICYFEDNRQCEEWAMLRGDCPVGGLKITGYATPAATYCAITGGTYAVTKEAPDVAVDQEQGSCTLKNGTVCDVWEYYTGKCPKE